MQKRKEKRSNILSNKNNAPDTKKMTYMYVCMSKSDLPAMFKSAPEFHYFHSDVSDLVKFIISLIIIYTIFERRDDELHLYSQQL